MAKLKDDAQSTKSTKTNSTTKTSASSLAKKAKSGLATLKRKATAVLSPKKKKARIPEDAETEVRLAYLRHISLLTSSSKVPTQAAPKKTYPKASVIDVHDDDDDKVESAAEDEEDELSTYYYLSHEKEHLPKLRADDETLDLSGLRILPPYSRHRIH
jgi:hypothetical protein